MSTRAMNEHWQDEETPGTWLADFEARHERNIARYERQQVFDAATVVLLFVLAAALLTVLLIWTVGK